MLNGHIVEIKMKTKTLPSGHDLRPPSITVTVLIIPVGCYIYLVVDQKRASAAEASDGRHSVLHVRTDQVNIIYLHEEETLQCYLSTLEVTLSPFITDHEATCCELQVSIRPV